MSFDVVPAQGATLAQAYCDRHDWRSDILFRYHYVITPKSDSTGGLAGWQSHDVGDWTLWRDHHLGMVRVEDVNRTTIGYCCGRAIGPDGTLLDDTLRLEFARDDPDVLSRIDALCDDIRGRYFLLINTGQGCCIWGDPVGDMGIVYDPETRRVGSTVPIVLTRRIDTGGLSFHDVKKGTRQYRFGATSDIGVFRLTPNFCLDLTNFSTRRFWPRALPEIVHSSADIDAVIEQLCQRLAINLCAFIDGATCALPVSGGMDSTLLLHLCSDAGIRPEFTYTHRNNWVSGYDAMSARQKCEALGFEHLMLDAVHLYEAEGDWTDLAKIEPHLAWLRGGFCLPMVKRKLSLASLLLPPVELVLRGNVMEMLGGRFHKSRSVGCPGDAYRWIFGRYPDSRDERRLWENGYGSWLADLPANMPGKTGLDLSFIENLFPYAMAVTLQSTPLAFYVNPFTDRRLIAAAMRIPSEDRVSGDFYGKLMVRNGHTAPLAPLRLGHADKHDEHMHAFIATTRADTDWLGNTARPRLF